jgi:DNA-binding transcriptional regulator PaaX
MSPLKQKILLLFLSGVAFGYSYTPQRQWRIIKELSREWKKINRKKLYEGIKSLYKSRFVERTDNSDGSITIKLTEKGKIKALTYRFQEMKINDGEWDKKWRMVVFDIPEKLKASRNALREKLKELGFYELQKSVWVFPYECKNEIDFVIEFF